jgi:hypothetical protein
MKRVFTFEKLDVAFTYASFYTGAFVLSLLLSSAITLSALTVGYGLADIVYAVTAPPDWTPTWDYTTIPAEDKCLIPPFQDEDYFVPPEVQLNDVKTIPAVYVKSKQTP